MKHYIGPRFPLFFQIGLTSGFHLYAGDTTLQKVDKDEWHSIVLTVDGRKTSAVVDNGVKRVVFETVGSGNVGAKLVLGGRERSCDSFIGCVKDLVCIVHAIIYSLRRISYLEFFFE